jgi:uncharacterized protein YbjT (DUF2867 family)
MQTAFSEGPEAEVRQGINIANVAAAAGVRHVVFGSAGPGEETGVAAWDSKVQVERHLRSLGLGLTILRPTAFMGLMVDKEFMPPVSTWQVMPAVMGGSRKIPWLSIRDLGEIVAKVFSQPGEFLGRTINLASDVRSIDECRAAYRAVFGKAPRRAPMPAFLFARFGFPGRDLTRMWRWLGTHEIAVDLKATRAIHPEALGVEGWLGLQRASGRAR